MRERDGLQRECGFNESSDGTESVFKDSRECERVRRRVY